jgi:hypothetical protein
MGENDYLDKMKIAYFKKIKFDNFFVVHFEYSQCK